MQIQQPTSDEGLLCREHIRHCHYIPPRWSKKQRARHHRGRLNMKCRARPQLQLHVADSFVYIRREARVCARSLFTARARPSASAASSSNLIRLRSGTGLQRSGTSISMSVTGTDVLAMVAAIPENWRSTDMDANTSVEQSQGNRYSPSCALLRSTSPQLRFVVLLLASIAIRQSMTKKDGIE